MNSRTLHVFRLPAESYNDLVAANPGSDGFDLMTAALEESLYRYNGDLEVKGEGHVFDDNLSWHLMCQQIVNGDVLVDRAHGLAYAVVAGRFHAFPNPFLAGA